MKYEKELKAFDERYKNDADFRAMADSDPAKALKEYNISDIKDFLDTFINSAKEEMDFLDTFINGAKEEMSEEEMGEIHGGGAPSVAGYVLGRRAAGHDEESILNGFIEEFNINISGGWGGFFYNRYRDRIIGR